MSLQELKLKYYCEVKDGTHDTPQYVDVSDNTFPLVTSKDITNGILSFDNAKHISYEDYLAINKRSNVEKYDVIMPMIGTVGNPAIVLTDEPFSIKNVALFKTSPDWLKAKYLKYILDSSYIKEQFNLNSRGGVQSFVSLTVLENLNILMPQKMKSVISYLDDKTKKVDALIDSKVKLINLLEQQRQSIITEAVTKGLNPNVKMKDSGVEWIGEIPEHWNNSLLKHYLDKLTDGSHFSPEIMDVGYPYITVKDLKNGYIDTDNALKINEEDYKTLVKNGCQPNLGDVLLSKDGTIGKVAIVKENDFVILSSLAILRPNKKLDPNYLAFWLDSLINKNQMESFLAGAALRRLTLQTIKKLLFVLPHYNEQLEIVDYLKSRLSPLDESILLVSKQLEKIKEYRQSLIYEAVTGKIEVRDMELDLVR